MSRTYGSLVLEREAVSSSRDASPGGRNERSRLLHRGRRHSYEPVNQTQASVYSPDAIYVKVDLFLHELKKRFDRLEQFKKETLTHFDAQLERGYQALREVRDACSPYHSGELLWGVARHRAKIFVETLEAGYNDVIPTRETLDEKAHASMKLMESYLSELEARAHSRRKDLLDSGWKRVDDSINATLDLFEEGYDKAKKAKDLLAESISHALKQAAESRLITYEDLPVPWRVNPHITRGYRFTESKIECITSMFKPSNETVNIWSHAIGLIIVLAIAFHYYPSSDAFASFSKMDMLIAGCFFAAACKCLICSTMWHTMNGIADKCLMERFACVDYTGISFLVAASILTTEWTAFYSVLGLAGTILPWRESFNRADMQWARVAFYVSLALTGFAPVLQLNITRGIEWTFYFYAPITKSVCVYFVGAIIYASHVPEKWWPGLFDYAGASHNIWHLAVLGGILFHYAAMMELYRGAFKRASECGCSIG
ncbi:inc metabolism membrane protein [Lithohypha guttulata]|uniref:Inc metabolism membrane protein n=1 Tax=Lithohypha guttulata TaxID=1690604 RepID=A0AAN7T6H5_9EURO|nr:inc metabolism membrane protein [Lithohypha guttulata]KAK5104700.1 inc metabolism membrane protein [Lithohypha guttulata]